MKICPACRKTYTDLTLNFCLDDGAVLSQYSEDDNSQPTVFIGQPPPTTPNTIVNPTINTNQQQFPPTPNNRGLSHTVAPRPPAKKSKTWIWVLGIVGLIVVLGGIGFIGLIVLIANNIDDSDNSNIYTDSNLSPTPTTSVTPVQLRNVLKDDFSKWRVDTNSFGKTEFRGGEYIMSSKNTNYYYVLISADSNFQTSDASTKITIRNVNGASSNSGYGILVHSDMKNPLVKDYGFLLDSSKQSYRIVQHTDQKETVLVNWTRFAAIRSGTQTNELEIKDQNGQMSLFINGQFAKSIPDTTKFKEGVFGLYVSDAIPIAFSNLQLGK